MIASPGRLIPIADYPNDATVADIYEDEIVTVPNPPLEPIGRAQMVSAIVANIVSRAVE